MRLVYIHQFFATNEGSGGTRSYDISRHLAARGHQVTMICGTTEVGGLDRLPWYRPFRRMRMAGFDVIVCNAFAANRHGPINRMLSFTWFALFATFAACFMVRRPDLVFATSLPLTVGIPGFIGARRHRVPFAFEVRDIFPEGDVISGNLRQGSPVERVLALLEWFCYIKADRILLVSPGFQKRLIERGYDGRKMRSILLGADKDLFEDIAANVEFRREHGLEGKTVAVYTGAHGRANGLHYILDAAEIIKDRDDIALVLIGAGREKPELARQMRERALTNVHLLDPVPKTELVRILAECDIGLMILADVGERPVTPNKIFDYMFSSLPSVVNFRGPTIKMVREDESGVFADPKKPQELADCVLHWADHPDEARAIGRHARQVALAKYDRRGIAAELVGTFREVLGGSKSARKRV